MPDGVQHTTLRPGTGADVTVSLRKGNDLYNIYIDIYRQDNTR